MESYPAEKVRTSIPSFVKNPLDVDVPVPITLPEKLNPLSNDLATATPEPVPWKT